jgi:hypothetical protein
MHDAGVLRNLNAAGAALQHDVLHAISFRAEAVFT